MNRREFVRLSVLDAICDDYENIDQIILQHVVRQGAKLGLTIERSEVVDALGELVRDGLAKAFDLSTRPFTELPGMPSLEVVADQFTYFYVTPKGMTIQLSDDVDWPFDDQGRPRREWRLDRE